MKPIDILKMRMGMIVQSMPYPGGPAPGTLLVGNSTDGFIAAGLISPNFQIGTAYQAVVSGTATTINFRARTPASTATYRLCVYGATSESAWGGALLAKTADNTGTTAGAVMSFPLITPISIVAGQWYALTVQSNGNVTLTSPNGAANERYFADAFSDGPASTATASPGLNSSAEPCVWLTA